MNSVVITGEVGRFRHNKTGNGQTVANFSVLSERRFSARDGSTKSNKVYMGVVVWGGAADLLMADGVSDGAVVLVQGHLANEKDQNDNWRTIINGQQVAVLVHGLPSVAPQQAPQAPRQQAQQAQQQAQPAVQGSFEDDDLPF
jgi:single-stranded DNA-binding protein